MTTTETTRNRYSIRKNDMIQVIAGRDKGKTGKVLRVNPKNGGVTVEKVNLVTRHMKPSQQNPQGGTIQKEAPLNYSNIQLFCPKCNRGVRHGHKFVEKKASKKGAKAGTQKIRICKRCDESLENA